MIKEALLEMNISEEGLTTGKLSRPKDSTDIANEYLSKKQNQAFASSLYILYMRMFSKGFSSDSLS